MAETAGLRDEEKLEQQYLKGSKDPDLGVYCSICSVKTGFEGQDGGAVTALLTKGLKDGKFDAAVVVKRTQGYNAEAAFALTPEEVSAAKGTKYLKISVLQKIRELAEQGKRKIAVTCTPCQARAVRKMQQPLKQKFPDLEITIIGLFCFESFNASKLKEEVKRVLNADLDRAERTEIRKGKFILHVDGQECSCRIRELDLAAEKECHFCWDFTSQLADVSVGAVGSKAGFSTVIARSARGEELLKGLDATWAEAEKEEIVKLSKFKATRAQKSHLEHQSQK
jgi:coenzyme F420-reducing hydrogenase beta subunit